MSSSPGSLSSSTSAPSSTLNSSILPSALSSLPSSLFAANSLGSMYSQSFNARSTSGNGGQNNYLNVNYSGMNMDTALHGRLPTAAASVSSSSSPAAAVGMSTVPLTPMPAPSPASYLYPSYSHSHEPSPSSTTPYPLPYPYANLNVYYPNSAPNTGMSFANAGMYTANAQNRSSGIGMSSSASNNNIRSMQSFEPIPTAYESNPASSNAAFQSLTRPQPTHSTNVNIAQPPRRVSQQDVYTPFNQLLDPTIATDPSSQQSQGQSTPFYPSNATGITSPSPMQVSAASSAAAVYHLNHRLSAAALQSHSPADNNSNFDSYAQGGLMSSFPYRVTMPLAMQSNRLPVHAQAQYLQPSAVLNEEIRSRKRKSAADNSDTSTSDNTPGDHSTSPNSPSMNASPFIMANAPNHSHGHSVAGLHPQLHQSLLSQAHAPRHPHSLMHFHGHQTPLQAGVLHPLAHGVYGAAHSPFLTGVPNVGTAVGDLLPSSLGGLSELSDEQLEQEAKFVLGDRQCELMTVMLREVGAWHRRQYWAAKLKESNDGAWRDFLNIARNRSLDLQTLEHHWQSRVCNPFDGHNMDKFNRRLAYLGLQVEWRRGTQKSEYRIIRITRMMPMDGNKQQNSEIQTQTVHGKKLNYRSAMWYKRAKRASDAEDSPEEDNKPKENHHTHSDEAHAESDSHDNSNDEEMVVQHYSGHTHTTPHNAKKSKASRYALKDSSSSGDESNSGNFQSWSPHSSSSTLSNVSSSDPLTNLVDWSVEERSDFLFEMMKSQVHPQTHSSDWHSPTDWSLLLKQHNTALWNQFVERYQSRGCATSLLNRTWRHAFRRPFYENLQQWNRRLAHLSDPFLIEERSDQQNQHRLFRISATLKIDDEQTAKKDVLIESMDEKKMNDGKSTSTNSTTENAQFSSERSASSPFDSSALDSQKPMDTIMHHPQQDSNEPSVTAFAPSMLSAVQTNAPRFNLVANQGFSASTTSETSSSSSSSSSSSRDALESFVSHPQSGSSVRHLLSTPTDMHVATSSAAITSESRAASAAKLFVF